MFLSLYPLSENNERKQCAEKFSRYKFDTIANCLSCAWRSSKYMRRTVSFLLMPLNKMRNKKRWNNEKRSLAHASRRNRTISAENEG